MSEEDYYEGYFNAQNNDAEEFDRIRTKTRKALDLHKEHQHNDECDSRPWAPCDLHGMCVVCGEDWPCQTTKVLTED